MSDAARQILVLTKTDEDPASFTPVGNSVGSPRQPGAYSSSKREPATQSNSPAAVRFCPPLTEEK